ncbi:tRNA epoxyqueuosine(34) reductase QueG [Undibacterium cyanobacteriorum]|uniref:Epoxyqueuosine reductase n=1 Tax=Undibacterium cyanobacteriorum TaxID=3073561 RepID=A0ABY9RHF3_9BURK|nr:tRNA epoxyqueuosine(34) reductase QueG [Undibacterium sp. 20NA77.5]WMW79722.1 tRNA epoxyqueuosine(34) reductase QueG [Undibacterium sp. 20NA77.5]
MSDLVQLAQQIKELGQQAGFADVRISDVDLSAVEPRYHQWIQAGYHGEMAYMESHGSKRYRPDELVPGTVRVISARMNYLPQSTNDDWRQREKQHGPDTAVISMYARGRDYHKVLRQRLQQWAERIASLVGTYSYRVFTDSAPVMEVALAEKAGLGWRGKHSLLLTRESGSLFFLGEILVDIPLPVDPPTSDHCGQCRSCMDVCPTQAIVAPYQVDARRCISYLTIELHGSIPVEFRQAIGNRVYGCDDCQLYCPWNKFAQKAVVDDFEVRHQLDASRMLHLFSWDEPTFLRMMEGSAIRRIGHGRWLRNLAVGLGNALTHLEKMRDDALLAEQKTSLESRILEVKESLRQRLDDPSEVVREHVRWALSQAS